MGKRFLITIQKYSPFMGELVLLNARKVIGQKGPLDLREVLPPRRDVQATNFELHWFLFVLEFAELIDLRLPRLYDSDFFHQLVHLLRPEQFKLPVYVPVKLLNLLNFGLHNIIHVGRDLLCPLQYERLRLLHLILEFFLQFRCLGSPSLLRVLEVLMDLHTCLF